MTLLSETRCNDVRVQEHALPRHKQTADVDLPAPLGPRATSQPVPLRARPAYGPSLDIAPSPTAGRGAALPSRRLSGSGDRALSGLTVRDSVTWAYSSMVNCDVAWPARPCITLG